jgi:hypothetical protein
LEALGKS